MFISSSTCYQEYIQQETYNYKYFEIAQLQINLIPLHDCLPPPSLIFIKLNTPHNYAIIHTTVDLILHIIMQ